MKTDLSTVFGALIGGAVGDAMGAPFEGLWDHSIPSVDSLVSGYHEYHGFPRGQFTDDTQLTIATVESIVECGGIEFGDIAARISDYWRHYTIVGPGGACTHAAEHFLSTGDWTSMGAPVGQAGNGTAMRTAVLGLLYLQHADRLHDEVAEISRLTHKDKRSVAGGIAIAEAARCLTLDPKISAKDLCDSVADVVSPTHEQFSELIRELATHYETESVLEFIASAGLESPQFERPIITPFVVPTVLAALYAVIANRDSWVAAVTSAIRFGGDVDTLGAIVGALAGIRHGISNIPEHLVAGVQSLEKLRTLAVRYHVFISSTFDS